MPIGEYSLILTPFPLKITTCYTKNCKIKIVKEPYYALTLI
jgi:hypothetical protein